jgi:branched-chain amino acid transport system substrate-binding protein
VGRAEGMRRVRRPVFWVAILGSALLLASSVSGCGGGEETGRSEAKGLPDEIVIGAAIAKTGLIAPFDASIAAMDLLIDEINAKGGIEGHKLRMVQADTRSDIQQAVVATEKVIEDGADVLLFTCEAVTASAQAAVAEEHGMLNFAPCEGAPGFGPPTTGRLSFSSSPSLLSEASSGAAFLHERGVQRPFLFRDTAFVYGKAHCSGFQQTWEHLGGQIAGSADFKITDESVASQVGELMNAEADAVVMCSGPPGGAAAIKQIRAAGIDIPILGPSAFDGLYWTKGIPNIDEIYITSNGSAYDPPDQATAKLLDDLERAGVDTDISTNLIPVYAGGQLIVSAIEETGSVDGGVIADALEAKAHDTIVGAIKYRKEDHYPTRTWPIYEFLGGTEKLVTQVAPPFIPEYGG